MAELDVALKKEQVIDDIHRQSPADMSTILQIIKQSDYNFSKDEILEIVTKKEGIHKIFSTPNKVAELISVIAEIYNPKSVVDIYCGTGNILSYFKELDIVKGIDINLNITQLAEYINPNADITVSNSLQYEFSNKKYDLVVGNLLFDASRQNGKPLIVELIKKGLNILDNNGVAIFIVNDGLLFGSSRAETELRQEILSNFALDMVISLPSGTFHPYTGIKTSILVIRNGKPNKDIFMPSFENNAVEIVDDFGQHKGGFYLLLSKIKGRLDREHYVSLGEIEDNLKGHEVIKLTNIAEIINGRQLNKNGFKGTGNYFIFNSPNRDGKNFVDIISNNECILQSDDIVICLNGKNNKISFYKDDGIQTIINKGYAIIRPKDNNKYIATYLQSESGIEFFKKQINRHLVGSDMLYLSLTDLENFDIPIITFSESEKLFSELVSDSFELSSRKERFLVKSSIYLFLSLESLGKKEYILAREYVDLAFELANDDDKRHKGSYLQNIDKARDLESKNKELNNLIAMFAHNFLGTLQCIRSNAEHENNPNIHLKTVKMMGGALTAFSIISADDDKLIEQLQQDSTGESSLLQCLANNLALAISQLLGKTNKDKIINIYLNTLQKTGQIKAETNGEELRFNKDNRKKWQALQHQWDDEFNALFSEQVELSQLIQWINDNFFAIEIIGFNDYAINFKEYGITDSIFLVVLMEILVNALKYMDVKANKPLTLSLCKQNNAYQLSCENPSQQESYRGTHKGVDFLQTIANKLNGEFISEPTENTFKTTFSIPAQLLD